MRITFVCATADLSGGFRVIATYAKRLKDRGHEVLVVSPPPPKPTLRERLRSVYRRPSLPVVLSGSTTHLDGTGVEHKVIDRIRPIGANDLPDADIVIATWWQTAEWVELLPPEKGVKIHFIQDYEIWGGQKERVDMACRLPMAKITPARWVRDLLAEQFGQTNVSCIPNSVDLNVFHSSPRSKQSQAVVGFTYTPFKAKGCDVTIEAIRLARLQLPDLGVVCFGSATPTAEMPLPRDAEFHLRAPEAMLKELYAKCDAWLFGTRKEGFGLPILEAMACHTPVIGTPAGAAPELLEGGGGVLVPMEDPRAMADAILRFAAMAPEAWRALSDAAYATASRYTWDDATEAFEAALKRAVALAEASGRHAIPA